jgi:ABC-2 type transport system permease protein
MAPVPVAVVLVCSSLWSYFNAGLRFVVYLVAGGILYGLDPGRADFVSAGLVFLLTAAAFMGIGILWAGVVLLVKRGESLMTMVSLGLPLVSGALFPVALLPGWMQAISALSPLTHALEGMRLALLQGASPGALLPVLGTLGGFAAALLAGGFLTVDLAVRAAKHAGSLTQY